MLRKPLVLTAGNISELPAGDTVGIVSIEKATITISDWTTSLETTISRPGTLATESVLVWLGATIGTDDNELWQLEGVNVSGYCQANAIAIVINCRYPEFGQIKLNYQVF